MTRVLNLQSCQGRARRKKRPPSDGINYVYMFDGRSLFFPSFVKGGVGNLDLMISQRALLFERVEKAVATRATAAIDLGSEWMKGTQNRKDPKEKRSNVTKTIAEREESEYIRR